MPFRPACSLLFAAAAGVALWTCGKRASRPGKRPTTDAAARPSSPPTQARDAGLPDGVAAAIQGLLPRLGVRDPTKLEAARKELRLIVLAHRHDVGLARWLVRHRHAELVIRGARQWAGLRRAGRVNNTQLLRMLESLIEHPNDRVRRVAVQTLFLRVTPSPLAAALPALRKLGSDPSCLVRHARLALLVTKTEEGALTGSLETELLAALRDPCPAVHALAAGRVAGVLDAKAPDKAVIARLLALADSKIYVARCEAIRALGRLRIPRARKAIARGLTVEAGTDLFVWSTTDRRRTLVSFIAPFPFVPACAAEALARLAGQKALNPKTKAWRQREGAAGVIPKAPANLCVANHCPGQDVCLRQSCTPLAAAAGAYWHYRRLRRCAPAAATPPKWVNATDDAAMRSGFGLDQRGIERVAAALKKTDPAAFAAAEKALPAKPCLRKPSE